MQFDIERPVGSGAPRASLIRRYERPLIGGVLALCVGIGIWLLLPPGGFAHDRVVTIPEGASAQEFAAQLRESGIIRSSFLFRAAAHLTGMDHKLDTGTYVFSGPQPLPIVLWRVAEGKHGIAPIKVTIPEGMTRFDIADELHSSLPDFDEEHFLLISSTSEGYLFPETYLFMPGTSAAAVLSRMKAQFASSTAGIFHSEHTESDTVIVASILEREAKTPEDMRIVAGILWSRLSAGMPLQVDAAFGYIHRKNGYVPTARDLVSDSPYNTYVHTGLPPTPISNPGFAALNAAANPTETPYLYYLTAPDGTMHYARTYVEHQKNIDRYLK